MRLALLTLITAIGCFAATPDLSGTWKLNSTKSEFGQFPAPGSMTQKITSADGKITVDMKMTGEQGEFAMNSTYTTDGKESTNTGFGGGETKSTAKWDADALVIDTKGSFGDNAFTMKDKWSLSADGKVLTVARHFSSGMGEMDQRMVFDKQ
jgi:hypothetical protein